MRNLIGLFLLALLLACNNDVIEYTDLDLKLEQVLASSADTKDYKYYKLPSSEDYASIPQDPRNPLTEEKINLGKMLFFETGLANNPIYPESKGTYSCASCHIPSAGFRPGRAQGIADGGLGFGSNGEGRFRNSKYKESEMDVQSARPLALINTAFVPNTMWNGSFGSFDANEGTEHLWVDAHEVNNLMLSGLEAVNTEGLHLHRMDVNQQVLDDLGYTQLYDQVFSDWPTAERYTNQATSFAISAYLRTILSNEAPFQKWLQGDNAALTEQEKKGAILFFNKARCASCHNQPNLGANEFYALGVNDLHSIASFNENPDDLRNLGRGGFTKDPADNYKFKVPQLYNLSDTKFFFHGSSHRTLEEVIEYFDLAIPENSTVPSSQIAPEFSSIGLSESEKADLLSFLENALRDPVLDRYVPDAVLSGNCFPNNDPQSRDDLGCY